MDDLGIEGLLLVWCLCAILMLS